MLSPYLRAAAAAAIVLAAGCESTPRPVANLTQAHTLIQQAEQSDAQQFASTDLEAARTKIREADADADHKPDVSRRLAQESSVDAGTPTLRHETQRNEINSGLNQAAAPAMTPPPPQPSQFSPPQWCSLRCRRFIK